jgi:DNA-binding CsgD family transcriptional regulator
MQPDPERVLRKKESEMSGGPVQLMAFGYGSAACAEPGIMAELDSLQGRGVLRLLDFLFVSKDEEGDLVILDIGDDDDYGAILAGFLAYDDQVDPRTPEEIDPDELAALTDELEPGTAMALVLVEHLWAGGLFSAVESCGGELLSEGFITDEGEVIIGAEVEAASEAARAIEEAHAAEAAARLQSLRAIGSAAAAVEAADEIRAAAAAEALDALVSAGLIEEAAANEAADALVEAGVIASEAQEAGAEAVAREVVNAEVAQDSVRAETRRVAEAAAAQERAAVSEAQRVAQAAAVQERAAIDEAETVAAQAEIREMEALEEMHATERFATQMEAEATSSLTGADKRLVHYLGTELTFAMIADKLKITRGAVKERASRVYKKLGVHSRKEAVAAAKKMGLLGG